MKAGFVFASTAWLMLLSGCQFDRSPLMRSPSGPRDASSGSSNSDASARDSAPSAAIDASQPEFDASVDAAAPDAFVPAPDTGPVANNVTDPTQTPHDPPPPPMTGGLQCDGVFCAFAVDPAKPCCTTQADVASRVARTANRCGLDLSALQMSGYGSSCWQRDQLGIVDDYCPNLEADSGVDAEPGCCGDDGSCGSVNASQKLGCRHGLGTTMQACGLQPGTTCDPVASFGVRMTVDAAWGGRSGGLIGLTDDGRGKIVVYLLAIIDGVDPSTHAVRSHGRVCGVVLPPFFSTTLCESYAPQFPDKIWESSQVPRLSLSGHYDCNGGKGCTLSLDPQTYLLGFELANPEAPWPTSAQTPTLTCPSGRGVKCFPDQDLDGKPGVAVNLLNTGHAPAASSCTNGYAFRGAPLSASVAAIFDGVRRTDRLELGVRMRLGGTTRLAENCDAAQGSAVAEYVNSRSAGCLAEAGTYNFPDPRTVAGANDPCDATEAQFLDDNLPVYQVLSPGAAPSSVLKLADKSPSHGPEVSLVRLGLASDAISCETVRTAKY